MNLGQKAVDYVVRMLRDPIDGSPSSARHAGMLLVVGALAVAIIGAVMKFDTASSVGCLAGGGAFQMFSRSKASKEDA